LATTIVGEERMFAYVFTILSGIDADPYAHMGLFMDGLLLWPNEHAAGWMSNEVQNCPHLTLDI
jgi:hypothetical protein